jgi:hypothetical protein
VPQNPVPSELNQPDAVFVSAGPVKYLKRDRLLRPVVRPDGSDKPNATSSPTQLTATIAASDLTLPAGGVVVFTPPPEEVVGFADLSIVQSGCGCHEHQSWRLPHRRREFSLSSRARDL